MRTRLAWRCSLQRRHEPDGRKDSGPPVKERLKELLAQAALSYGAGAEARKENFKVGDNPAMEYSLSFTNQGKKLKLRCRAFFAHG